LLLLLRAVLCCAVLQVTDWLRNCYTEATALVDEHGVIHGKDVGKADMSLPEQLENMRRKVRGRDRDRGQAFVCGGVAELSYAVL
jgi:hypothetical protein